MGGGGGGGGGGGEALEDGGGAGGGGGGGGGADERGAHALGSTIKGGAAAGWCTMSRGGGAGAGPTMTGGRGAAGAGRTMAGAAGGCCPGCSTAQTMIDGSIVGACGGTSSTSSSIRPDNRCTRVHNDQRTRPTGTRLCHFRCPPRGAHGRAEMPSSGR